MTPAPEASPLRRVVSGGQTGVDRAALDVALELGFEVGGWIPKGRRAEDGPLPARYPLAETGSKDYAARTARNVRDSDGTLVLTRGEPTGGTALTIKSAEKLGRPCLVVDLDLGESPGRVAAWAARYRVATLNVAGPRESGQPGIYDQAARWLRAALADCSPGAAHAA